MALKYAHTSSTVQSLTDRDIPTVINACNRPYTLVQYKLEVYGVSNVSIVNLYVHYNR